MPSNRPVIHVLFFVGNSGSCAVLPLTDTYEAVIHPPSPLLEQASPRLTISHSTSAGQVQSPLKVASFTTLYGENGSGKTALLLELCQELANRKSRNHLSLLWEDAQGLHLSRGSSLKDVQLDSKLEIDQGQSASIPDFSTVFYTTSPFEKLRRNRLRRLGVKDISPRFGKDVESELVAAFTAYPFLKERVTFVGEAQVTLKLRTVSLVELMTLYRSERSTSKPLDPELKQRLLELDRGASPEAKFIWSYAILEGAESLTAQTLYEVVDELQELVRDHNQWLSRALSDPDFALDQLSEHPPLIRQLTKARYALERVKLLFADVTSWGRKSGLGYLDGQVGQHIRQYPQAYAELSNLGLLQFSFTQLSSGQASMMSLYCAVARAFGEFEQAPSEQSMLLCIDEGEMFMHPKWQRIYIFDLLEFIGKFGRLAKRTHVLISTHSLIVAADTPAGRLFDLDNARLTSAFGYTPKQTLTSVFEVEDFTGKFNHQRLEQLAAVLNGEARSDKAMRQARHIADALANDELKRHVQHQLDILGSRANAQA
ncbi:ATP-binding protein [Pseudomonas sp. L5B5]|uniref:ATP-binding protein n=1 Tax=Pseudomonas sp. L5B5 TaxID=2883205 RepID=UPI001CF99722|nr:ATP-binding protein [Pseudomonas sp. L5B5]UCZ85367.1 ATP-binding protein [Pseudomonas sp. L5B5]